MSADFDKAIDRAVREMLDVEPSDGLRQRVIERLPARTLVASSFSWKILLPVAAAAVLALAVWLTRSTPPQSETTTVSVEQPQAPSPAATPGLNPPAVPVKTPGGEREPRAVAAVRAADRIVAGATYSPAAPVGDIEPLQSLAPIEVAPVAQRAITEAVVTIPPLNPIADLEIAPLNPPDRRN